MLISKYFSDTELRLPSDSRILANARHLCTTVLDDIRDYVGEPILITSGYRAPDHNAATGGVRDSEHEYEDDHAAADFRPTTKPLREVFDWICQSGLPFRQVILEFGKDSGVPECIHISARLRGNDKHQALIGQTHGTGSYSIVPCK